MNRLGNRSGRIRAGLVIFIVLLVALAGRFVYKYVDTATRLNDEAVELMNQGKYDSALEKLDEAIAADPEHIQAQYHRGICLAEKHRWDEAISAFDQTAALDPEEADAYFNKAKILWHLERYEEAIPFFERAIEHQGNLEEPNRKSVWRFLGECFYEIHLGILANQPDQESNPARAEAAFKTYLKEHPGAVDKSAVEQKLEVLANPDDFKEIVLKRKKDNQKPPVLSK